MNLKNCRVGSTSKDDLNVALSILEDDSECKRISNLNYSFLILLYSIVLLDFINDKDVRESCQ